MRSKIKSKYIFLIKYYVINILKKIDAFRPLFNKVKKLIFHCIFKSCAEGFRFFLFKLGSKFVCLMACIYLLNSRGGPRRFDFDITYYLSNYRYPLVLGGRMFRHMKLPEMSFFARLRSPQSSSTVECSPGHVNPVVVA